VKAITDTGDLMSWEKILKKEEIDVGRRYAEEDMIEFDLKKLFQNRYLITDDRQRANIDGSIEFHIIFREIKRKYPDMTPNRLRDYLDEFNYYGPTETRDGRQDVYISLR